MHVRTPACAAGCKRWQPPLVASQIRSTCKQKRWHAHRVTQGNSLQGAAHKGPTPTHPCNAVVDAGLRPWFSCNVCNAVTRPGGLKRAKAPAAAKLWPPPAGMGARPSEPPHPAPALTCGAQSTARPRRTRSWRSTFAGRWRARTGWSRRSRRCEGGSGRRHGGWAAVPTCGLHRHWWAVLLSRPVHAAQ